MYPRTVTVMTTDFYELGGALPLLEGFLHQRESDKACGFTYHNVVLQGSYLRYIAQPLKPKDIGSFRLVLVQGKHKGRMVSIYLNQESEVNPVTMSAEALNEYPTPYLINISGKNMNYGKDIKLQLALPSEEAQLQWLDSLRKAKDYATICESNGETKMLINLAEEMKEEIGISNRLYQFKIYRKCFLGSKAVRWLQKTKGFTQTQAISIGNKMIYLDIIKEVANQHMFLDKNILYQFTSDINGTNSAANTPTKPKFNKSASNKNDTESNEVETTLDDLLDGILNRGLNEDSSPVELLSALRNSEDECARFKGGISELLKEYDAIHDIYTEMFSTLQQIQLLLTTLCVVLVLIICNNNVSIVHSNHAVATNTALALLTCFIILYKLITRKKTSKFVVKSLSNQVRQLPDQKGSHDSKGDNITMEEAEELMLEKVGLQRIGNEIEDEEVDSDDENDEYDTLERTPSLDSISEVMQNWPNDPIMVRRSPHMIRSDITEQREHLCLPVHIHNKESPELSFISIDSDYFIGKCYLLIAGLKDSPAHFRKRKRKLQAIIQGRFKKDIPFSKVYIGEVFEGAIRQLSAKLLLYNSIKILSKFNPVLNVRMKGERPYILTPLVTAAQNIVVSQPGQEPNIMYPDDLEEDMSQCSATFRSMSSLKRKQYFSKRANLELYSFDSSMVYTFDFYQHLLNVATLDVDLGFLKYDLVKVLGARPLQIMAVIWSPPRLWLGGRSSNNGRSNSGSENENNSGDSDMQYVYNIEIWNKRSTSKFFVNKRNNDRAVITGSEIGESSE